jgi:hydroxymethylpyrimidine pyrophosphatase-like HAD family hydrolase
MNMRLANLLKSSLVIAVDFDGTIVEHRYPEIGRVRPLAFQTLKALQSKGHRLILWTYRKGKELDEAVNFCHKHGIEFYAVNRNYPDEVWGEKESRKILADVYIDDRNLGGIPSWGEIFRILCPEEELDYIKKKTSWWKG